MSIIILYAWQFQSLVEYSNSFHPGIIKNSVNTIDIQFKKSISCRYNIKIKQI